MARFTFCDHCGEECSGDFNSQQCGDAILCKNCYEEFLALEERQSQERKSWLAVRVPPKLKGTEE